MSQLRCLWAPLPGSLKGAEGGEKKTVREQHREHRRLSRTLPNLKLLGAREDKGARRQQARLTNESSGSLHTVAIAWRMAMARRTWPVMGLRSGGCGRGSRVPRLLWRR